MNILHTITGHCDRCLAMTDLLPFPGLFAVAEPVPTLYAHTEDWSIITTVPPLDYLPTGRQWWCASCFAEAKFLFTCPPEPTAERLRLLEERQQYLDSFSDRFGTPMVITPVLEAREPMLVVALYPWPATFFLHREVSS